jgi:hypothetical protein
MCGFVPIAGEIRIALRHFVRAGALRPLALLTGLVI